MAYHRFLVPPADRAKFESSPEFQNQFSFYRVNGQGYDMNNMGAPPVYDASRPVPPTYQPPEGASKANPSQGFEVQSSLEAQQNPSYGMPASARSPRSGWAKLNPFKKN